MEKILQMAAVAGCCFLGWEIGGRGDEPAILAAAAPVTVETEAALVSQEYRCISKGCKWRGDGRELVLKHLIGTGHAVSGKLILSVSVKTEQITEP